MYTITHVCACAPEPECLRTCKYDCCTCIRTETLRPHISIVRRAYHELCNSASFVVPLLRKYRSDLKLILWKGTARLKGEGKEMLLYMTISKRCETTSKENKYTSFIYIMYDMAHILAAHST